MCFSFTKDESDGVKGLAIVLVILHHYFAETNTLLPAWVFKGAGAMACSIFFFLSAYGLTVSGKHIGGGTYWYTRIRKIIIPMIIANILLVLYSYFFRDYSISWKTITDILGITSLNHPIWFLQVLILMYLALFVSNRFKINGILCCFAAGVLYTLITRRIGCISWVAFPFGLYVCHKNINSILSYIAAVIWIPSYICYLYNGCMLNSIILLLNFIVALISFVFFVQILLNLFRRLNSWKGIRRIGTGLRFLGKNSIYLYLLHATVIYFISDFLGLDSRLSFLCFIVALIVYTTLFVRCISFLKRYES